MGTGGGSVTEHAVLRVRGGQEDAFLATFAEVRHLIEATPGFGGLRLCRSIESPSTFVLLVEWDSIEAHTDGFRGSDRYPQWSARLHPFYDPFPVVEHVVDVLPPGQDGAASTYLGGSNNGP